MEGLFAFVRHDMTGNREMAAAETIASESEKFTSPLLFVHGLFAAAAGWRRFMGYCAHRGWTCHSLDLPRQGSQADSNAHGPRLGVLVDAVTTAASIFNPRPVLIGHDLGGLLALAAAKEARAVVALAPLLPSSVDSITRSLVLGWRNKVAALRSQPMTPTSDDYLCGADALGFLVPESSRFLRAVGSDVRTLCLGGPIPILVVGAEFDRFAPVAQLQALAHQIGADFTIASGARHGLPWDKGWEKTVATVHRWIVQTLGEDLLIVRDDEDDEG